jgi:hypothetical protein
MGCDIHLYVEVKKKGKWEPADEWSTYEKEYGDEDKDTNNDPVIPYGKGFYNSRNYSLFGMLANVRNGVGFAGVDTGEALVPIAEPRGLPDDVSSIIRENSDHWGGDGHSHSHLTVKELMEYDWTRTAIHRGVVNVYEYMRWSHWGKSEGQGPESYCGGVSGPGIRYITEKQMDSIVEDILQDGGKQIHQIQPADLKEHKNLYCKIQWETPYYESATVFLSQALPRMWRLGKPENVRIVFWFDN